MDSAAVVDLADQLISEGILVDRENGHIWDISVLALKILETAEACPEKHTFDSICSSLHISRDAAVAGVAHITLCLESPSDSRYADVSEKARLLGFERLSATEFCTAAVWTSIWQALEEVLLREGAIQLPGGLPAAHGIAPTLLQQRVLQFIESPSDGFPDCAVVSGSGGGKLLVTAAHLARLVAEADAELASAAEPTKLASLQAFSTSSCTDELRGVVAQAVSNGDVVATPLQTGTPGMQSALFEATPPLRAHNLGEFKDSGALFVPKAHAASQRSDTIARFRSDGFMSAADAKRLQLHDAFAADASLSIIAEGDWIVLASLVEQAASAVIAELDPSEGAAWCDASLFLPAALPTPLVQAFMQHTAKAVHTQLESSAAYRLGADELAALAGLPSECDAPCGQALWLMGSVFVSREWAEQLARFLSAHGRLDAMLGLTLQENKRIRAELLSSLRAAEAQVSIAQLSCDNAGTSPLATADEDSTCQDSIGSFVMVDLDESHPSSSDAAAAVAVPDSSLSEQAEVHQTLAAMKLRLQAVQKALSVWDISMTAVMNAEKHGNTRRIAGCSDVLPVLCLEDPCEKLAMTLLHEESLAICIESGCDMARVFRAVCSQLSGDLLVLALTEGDGRAIPACELQFGGASGIQGDTLWQALRTSIQGGTEVEASSLLHPVVLSLGEVVWPVSSAAGRAELDRFKELTRKNAVDSELGQAAPTVSPQLGGLPSHPPVARKHAQWVAQVALVASFDAAAPLARGCFDVAVAGNFPRIPRDHWSVDLVQAQEMAHALVAEQPWLAEDSAGASAAASDGLVQTVHDGLQKDLAQRSALAFTAGLTALVSDLLLLRTVVVAGKAAPGALSALALSALGAAAEQLQLTPPAEDGDGTHDPAAVVFPSGLPLLAAYMPTVVPVQAQLESASSAAAAAAEPVLPQELLTAPQRDAMTAWLVHCFGPTPGADGTPPSIAALGLTRVDSSASGAAAASGDSATAPAASDVHSGTQAHQGAERGPAELAHLLAVHASLLASCSDGKARDAAPARVPVVSALCAVEAALATALPLPEEQRDPSDSDGSDSEEEPRAAQRGKGRKRSKDKSDKRKALPRGRKGKGTRASPWAGKHRGSGGGTATPAPVASNTARASGLLTALAASDEFSAAVLEPQLCATAWAVLAAAPQDDVGAGGQVELLLPVLQRKSEDFAQQWSRAVSSLGKRSSLLACILRSVVDDKDKKLKREQKAEHSAALHALGSVASGKLHIAGHDSCTLARIAAVQVGLAARGSLGVPPVSAVHIAERSAKVHALLLLSSARVEAAAWVEEWC